MLSAAYFNENDPYPAQWLRNLFPDATIDDRSIKDVRTIEHSRAHFFAGIGGWEYALQLAGWPEEREVWTGSCPCQPFSQAGKRKGTADARHLWPVWYELIKEHQPATIFGEQVASKDGREWLAGVRADLEALGYVVGAADLCAAGVGAPHVRQRLYWVANRDGSRERVSTRETGWSESSDHGETIGLPNPAGDRRRSRWTESEGQRGSVRACGDSAPTPRVGDCDQPGSQGHEPEREHIYQWPPGQASLVVVDSDGNYRRIEPSILPLAHGVPNRVGRIRAYGNAIVPQVAAEFIRAYLETET